MMARPPASETSIRQRLVDARHHFLGLIKGEELLVYCRRCKRFLSVMTSVVSDRLRGRSHEPQPRTDSSGHELHHGV